jgi:hypothetical protein
MVVLLGVGRWRREVGGSVDRERERRGEIDKLSRKRL